MSHQVFRWNRVVTSAVVLTVTLLLAAAVQQSQSLFPSSKNMDSPALSVLFQEGPLPPGFLPEPEPLCATHPGGPTDPKELERFLHTFFARYMPLLHVPGATFSMVKDGKLFFAKGYGYADMEQKTPVLPDRTLFRVGSISKLFMATAAMQLKEQGKLDLDRDVNQYLKQFQLPRTYPKPVTMANLLTHTGGFDEQIIGMAARSEEQQRPLGAYLADRMPPRVMPPGDVISYSNHGSALAGHVIEEVSGELFPDYVDRHLLEPLEMRHTSFRLPSHLAPDMAAGYDYNYQTGKYERVPFDYLNVAPAGALNTTALDITHFMIAHLQEGCYGSRRILQQYTVREMHQQHFTHHPRLPGFAYGFYERSQNGKRSIEHGGLWRGFGSQLFLLPSEHLGFFVSCNQTQSLLGALLTIEFVNHYYPRQQSLLAPARQHATDEENLQRYAGDYRFNRYDRHTPCKMGAMFNDLKIRAQDGALRLEFASGLSSRWLPVEPLLFRLEGGDQYLAFRERKDGRITHAFAGMAALEKLSWYDTREFHQNLVALILICFIGAAGCNAIFLLRPRLPSPAPPAHLRRISRISLLVSDASVFFLVVFQYAFWGAGFNIVYGPPVYVVLLLCIPLITTALVVRLAIDGVRAWNSPEWSAPGKIQWALVIGGSILYTWFLYYWNLLGFQF